MKHVWRVGSKIALNVYEGDRPVCQCHSEKDAIRIVASINAEDTGISACVRLNAKLTAERARMRHALSQIARECVGQLGGPSTGEIYHQCYWGLVGDPTLPGDQQAEIMRAAIDGAPTPFLGSLVEQLSDLDKLCVEVESERAQKESAQNKLIASLEREQTLRNALTYVAQTSTVSQSTLMELAAYALAKAEENA